MGRRSRREKREKRPPESYAGKTPEARAAQLGNLRNAPAAPAGNQLARKHGAYSRVDPDRVDAQVARLVDLLAQDPPLRAPDGSLPREDALIVELLARALVRLRDVGHWVTMHGVLGEDGNPRPAVALEGELRREAAGYAEALGMTPAARAKLGLDVAEASALITGAARRDWPDVFATDPDVRAAGRAMVRAVEAVRDRELDEQGEQGAGDGDGLGGAGGPAEGQGFR
jgi:hypothetical protein